MTTATATRTVKSNSIVFDFSWDDCNNQEKLETMVMQNVGGVKQGENGE